jgi:predicted RNA polymerase sigma factor
MGYPAYLYGWRISGNREKRIDFVGKEREREEKRRKEKRREERRKNELEKEEERKKEKTCLGLENKDNILRIRTIHFHFF